MQNSKTERVVKGEIFISGKGFCPGEVHIDKGIITDLLLDEADFTESAEYSNNMAFEESKDTSDDENSAEKKYRILPGLIDIHLHGANGYDFCDGTIEAIKAIDDYENRNGIVRFCGATMTLDEDAVTAVCDASKRVIDSNDAKCFCGIYLEGPFISGEKCGAQNKEYLRIPDISFVERLYKKSGECIKYVVVAPELSGVCEMIKDLKDKGIKCSIGHSEADYETALEAVNCGADHITHLYNAMTAFGHRNPGITGLALDDDRIETELITDGIHLHPAVVRVTFDAKASGKIILVSDSTMATGLADGRYHLGDKEIIVKDKTCILADGTIAGGAHNLYECMTEAIKMGVDYVKAIDAATINPAKSLGIDDMYGCIDIGKSGRLIIADENYEIVEVLG